MYKIHSKEVFVGNSGNGRRWLGEDGNMSVEQRYGWVWNQDVLTL